MSWDDSDILSDIQYFHNLQGTNSHTNNHTNNTNADRGGYLSHGHEHVVRLSSAVLTTSRALPWERRSSLRRR
jgi:hypothetical protein